MAWRCPACTTQISHFEAEASPRVGARYRCHVCRLELILDPLANKLTIAPLEALDAQAEPKATKRDAD